MKITQNVKKNQISSLTGIAIIRVAAFAFAIVSWKATANGLSEYVFGGGWQPALISFAIQAILFVFNLKLPFYFNRIGENSPNRKKRRYFWGQKRGKEKDTYKTTVFQKVIVVFYIVVLFSSSFFSFIYICNYVVYEHQSGYVDDNTILNSSYREILNDTNEYIVENIKAMQILASKSLGNLQNDFFVVNTSNDNAISKEELEDLVSEAQDTYDIAKEQYEAAKQNVDAFETEKNSYANSREDTNWHDRQDEWEKKYEVAKKEWENAIAKEEEKSDIYETARRELTEAKNVLKNYKDSQETVIAEFLLEMLRPTPNPDVLEEYISKMNKMIVELETDVNILDDYSELVERTQTLIQIVKNYISLVRSQSSGDINIEYLLKNKMDDVVIPDPKSKSFNKEYSSWSAIWNSKINSLENLIQNLPKFSENMSQELKDTVVNTEFLEKYNGNDKIKILDELRRSKISDINVIEKVSFLLLGKYKFTAWFSLGLAIFFDVSSLLAGLFIYGIQKKFKV